jgi:hypothetical protein
VLQALAAVFWKNPAAVGAVVGARWRSRAAAVDLHPRRRVLLPLRRASPSSHTPAIAGEFLAEPEVDDARAPLDSNPMATYRFGFYKWPDE